jgi:hypothetical protein
MLTPSLVVTAQTEFSILRELPVKGTINVKVGQSVRFDGVIGESIKEGELFLIKVTEELGIESDKISNVVTKRVGDKVLENEIIAAHKGLFGLFSSEIRSQVSGVVEFISVKTGHLGIRMPSTILTLTAFITGTVKEVEAGKGCVIVSNGALIQGAFGVGGERVGSIKVLPVSPDTTLAPEHITSDLNAGDIVVGGTNPSVEFFNKARERGIIGIVTGGCSDEIIEEVSGKAHGVAVTGDEPIPFTIILTEGFGAVPLSEKVIAVAKAHEGKMASIQGMTQVRAGAVRPFVMIASENTSTKSSETKKIDEGFKLGQRVRLIQMSRFGQQGTIKGLPIQPQKIATGAVVRVMEVTLASGEDVVVPRANVEVIG